MIRASRNVIVGSPVTDFQQFLKLARERKSVVEWRIEKGDNKLRVKPAAFYLNWPLSEILKSHFFESVKK